MRASLVLTILTLGLYSTANHAQYAVDADQDASVTLISSGSNDPRPPGTNGPLRYEQGEQHFKGYVDPYQGASAVLIPSGPSDVRPAGVNGLLRYNQGEQHFEGYVSGQWEPLLTGASEMPANAHGFKLPFGLGDDLEKLKASVAQIESLGNKEIAAVKARAAKLEKEFASIQSRLAKLELALTKK